MKINSTTYVPYLALRFFDKEHRFGLINHLLNYLGLDIFKSELCELDQILGKKILNNLMIHL
jgi:hypothetical protein